MEKISFFYDFYGFGGIRSTQPTMRCSPRSPCLGELSFHGFARRIRSGRFLTKWRLRKFTTSLLDVACMEKISFFYDFYGFGGIRSTQPTMRCSPRSPCLGELSFHGFARRIRSGRFLTKWRLRKFTTSLLDVACMEKISFFYDFYGFGGIRSTQPTMRCSPRSPCLGELSFHGFARRIRSGRFLTKWRLRKSCNFINMPPLQGYMVRSHALL